MHMNMHLQKYMHMHMYFVAVHVDVCKNEGPCLLHHRPLHCDRHGACSFQGLRGPQSMKRGWAFEPGGWKAGSSGV